MLAFAIGFAVASAQQSVILRYKFHVGQTRAYSMGMNMNMNMNMGTKAVPMDMKFRLNMKQTVKSVAPDGTASLDMAVTTQSSTVNGQDSPVANPGKISTATMKMSPLGKVSALSGKLMESSRMQGFDPSQMAFAGAFPVGPVHVGSQWASAFSLPKLGNIDMHYTLEALRPEGGSVLAIIRAAGTMDMSHMSEAMGGKLPGMKISGSNSFNGTITLNVTHGFIKATSMTGSMDMKMAMNNPQDGKPMSFSMGGTEKMDMQLVH